MVTIFYRILADLVLFLFISVSMCSFRCHYPLSFFENKFIQLWKAVQEMSVFHRLLCIDSFCVCSGEALVLISGRRQSRAMENHSQLMSQQMPLGLSFNIRLTSHSCVFRSERIVFRNQAHVCADLRKRGNQLFLISLTLVAADHCRLRAQRVFSLVCTACD